MPTPRPMSVQSWDVKDAMLMELDSMPTTDSPANSAIPVLMSGSSDPNTMSSTMSAAAMPMKVPLFEDGFVEAATLPTTSTFRCGEFGARARLTSLVASAAGMTLASLVKLTEANAILPFALICLAPAAVYGEVMLPTYRRCATRASIPWIWVLTAGSVTAPGFASKTICSVSPETDGAARCNRLAAWALGVPDSWVPAE